MGVASQYVASSASIADGAITEAKLAAEACSAAKMKKEGNAGEVLTSNGAGAVPSYQAASAVTLGGNVLTITCNSQPDTTTQGTWASEHDTTQALAGNFNNGGSTNQHDEVIYKASLAAGTYSVFMVAQTRNSGGIVKLFLNSTEIASFDTYSGVEAKIVNFSKTGIAVASTGIYSFKVEVADKNGSSSDYELKFSLIELRRTA